ncbi:UNVERIFIED_CONTAM: mitochondrial chaperone [Siphonaria sp. JEL0065]|nr:mitochondrial chaperone [Siphonaria sp. JEL0065]
MRGIGTLRRPGLANHTSLWMQPLSRGLSSSSGGSGGRTGSSEHEVVEGMFSNSSTTSTPFLASFFEAVGLPPPNAFTQSGLTLAALGAGLALVRGLGGFAWTMLERRLIVSVEIDGRDESHAWILAWLSEQPFVKKSTRFAVAVTPSTGRATTSSAALDEEYAHLPSYAFLPSPNCTHWFWYNNRFMWITRSRPKPSSTAMAIAADAKATERIVVSTLGSLWNREPHVDSVSDSTKKSRLSSKSQKQPSNQQQQVQQQELIKPVASGARRALEQLVEESRRKFAERDLKRTVIYSADQYGNWRRTRSRPIRPLSTIVLEGETKDTVLSDAIEFLRNEKWYADRGIPYRRGYMFYGYPGTGKTSFVTALAGELKLNIYVISLANKGLTDETLTELMVDTPPRCILLLEDIDAAFVSRTLTSTASQDNTIVTNVTFSGLLNAIDGVAAQEGRILIMTTNHIEKLDAALIRPGRVDVKVLFDKATQKQVHDLFIQFFNQPPVPAAENVVVEQEDPDTLQELATQFSRRFPERGVSMAAVQGHLMRYKRSPRDAVAGVDEFVESVVGVTPVIN